MNKWISFIGKRFVRHFTESGHAIVAAQSAIIVLIQHADSRIEGATGPGTLSFTSDELESQTIAEIALLPRPSREHLLALAKIHKPPLSWYEGED